LALHPPLVPRGVGIGTMVGIFLMIPGLQIIGAALVSLPFRANVAVAGAMTFLSNPFTTPFIILASIQVGNSLGFHADLETFTRMKRAGRRPGPMAGLAAFRRGAGHDWRACSSSAAWRA
jgi:hypothetical protein